MLSREFYKISKTTYFYRTPPAGASVLSEIVFFLLTVSVSILKLKSDSHISEKLVLFARIKALDKNYAFLFHPLCFFFVLEIFKFLS